MATVFAATTTGPAGRLRRPQRRVQLALVDTAGTGRHRVLAPS